MMRENKAAQKHPSAHPSDLLWAIATLSLVLPWVAIFLGGVSLWRILSGDNSGWLILPAAIGLFALDIVIDLWIANPRTSASDEPDLNRRGSQYVGRVVALDSAIETGRGRVRLGDTVWTVEGPDLPESTPVRIVGSDGAVLRVEAAEGGALGLSAPDELARVNMLLLSALHSEAGMPAAF